MQELDTLSLGDSGLRHEIRLAMAFLKGSRFQKISQHVCFVGAGFAAVIITSASFHDHDTLDVSQHNGQRTRESRLIASRSRMRMYLLANVQMLGAGTSASVCSLRGMPVVL
jgi:hypothetical protein